ncbi:transcription termination factor 2-like isoform X2 [Dermacentor albipictus]|uniref:transcription termination factor 2-like isoform X2 n=1 Tax=Dermacentor albipictus TaxID=60249 RepID=UPI0038FCA9F9
MERSGECVKKMGDPEQLESIRQEKSEAFSRHRGDKQKVPKPPAPSQSRGLEDSSKMPTKDAPATRLPLLTKSKEALELEIQKKKKVMGTIKLNTLPDGGKRLKEQLKALEDQLLLLCLSVPGEQGNGRESSSAEDTNTTAKHSCTSYSRGESRSDVSVEKAGRQADTVSERTLPASKESKKSAPTESDVREHDSSKEPHQCLQTKGSSDAHSSNASAGVHKKHSDRLSHDREKSRAVPESAGKQRTLESKENRVQSSLQEHILADNDLSRHKCESTSQSTTAADIPLKGTSSLTSVEQGSSGGVVAKRRPVSPVARAGICGEEPRPPTTALHSVYDRRVLLVSPLPLSKTAAPLAVGRKGATLEALGTRVPRGLSERSTARLQYLFQSLSSQPDEWDESPQPEGVRTPLMPHQRQALRWMLWREEQEAPGGILADAMGLGKTLTMLTLVEQQWSNDKSYKSATGIESSTKCDDSDDCERAAAASPRGGTLVVCPLSLLHQWEEEVQRHLPNRWQVKLHHGRNRTGDPKELARCDLVVTTYDTISSDWARVDATGNSGLSPLFTVRWRRLVLDEAHSIRNLHTRRAKAACALFAWSHWALTGTPVHNDLGDMRSLLKFLQCRPFDDDAFWKQWIKENSGPEALAMVMKCVLLRRTKEQMGKDGKPLVPLPKKSIVLHRLSLEGTEAKVYKELDEWSRSSGPEKYTDPVTGRELYRNTGSRRFVMLIRLQQACSHLALLKKKVLEDAAVDTDELLSASMAGLQLSDETAAGEDRLDALNLDKYTSAREFDSAYVSCKIRTLLDMLLKVREESNNQDKSVVVSRWTSLLSLVRRHLERRGIPCVTIQGSIPGHQRASHVTNFNQQRGGPTVMLLSLEAGGVGLNLIGGNHMFVLDVHWNPALEAQAFDRIHRVGQTKTVVINRLICAGTIEERILELQKHKQQLAESVVARRRLTANDYDFLFARSS